LAFIIRSWWRWRFLICRTSHFYVVSNEFKFDNIIKTDAEQCVSDSAAILGKATAAVTIRKTQNFVTHWLPLFKIVYNLKRSQFTVASVLYLQTRDGKANWKNVHTRAMDETFVVNSYLKLGNPTHEFQTKFEISVQFNSHLYVVSRWKCTKYCDRRKITFY